MRANYVRVILYTSDARKESRKIACQVKSMLITVVRLYMAPRPKSGPESDQNRAFLSIYEGLLSRSNRW